MKVTVDVHFATDSKVRGANSKLSLVVKPSDTVQRLKQRVTLVEPVPFPEQDLQLDGASLKDDQRLGDLNLHEGQVLRMTVRASEKTFTDQLAQLLKARPLSSVELGLLYTHRFGATVKTALSILGCPEPLRDFLLKKKGFAVDPAGFVSLSESKEPAAQLTPSVAEDLTIQSTITVSSTLGYVLDAKRELRAKSTHTVQSLCERTLASELVPFEASKMTLQGQELEGRQQLGAYKMTEGSTLNLHVEISKELLCHQLSGLLLDRGLSLTELGDLYCYRYGAPPRRALELLGLRCTLKEFVTSAPEYFQVRSGCITLRAPAPAARSSSGDLNQQYLQLDAKIANCKLVQDAALAFDQVVDSAQGTSLAVGRALFLGSVGRGTAIAGNADAQVVLLLKGMTAEDREKWLPPLLTELASAMSQDFGEAAQVSVSEGALHIHLTGASVEVVLDVIGGPLALAADRSARLFEKLPAAVKVTMRLVKWWRNQQEWSSAEERPSDLLLEHIVASTAVPVPADQVAAVSTALHALASFDQLSVVDATDPTSKLADSKSFKYQQLVQLATKSAGRLM